MGARASFDSNHYNKVNLNFGNDVTEINIALLRKVAIRSEANISDTEVKPAFVNFKYFSENYKKIRKNLVWQTINQ